MVLHLIAILGVVHGETPEVLELLLLVDYDPVELEVLPVHEPLLHVLEQVLQVLVVYQVSRPQPLHILYVLAYLAGDPFGEVHRVAHLDHLVVELFPHVLSDQVLPRQAASNHGHYDIAQAL
jgi:hypothetical protein